MLTWWNSTFFSYTTWSDIGVKSGLLCSAVHTVIQYHSSLYTLQHICNTYPLDVWQQHKIGSVWILMLSTSVRHTYSLVGIRWWSCHRHSSLAAMQGMLKNPAEEDIRAAILRHQEHADEFSTHTAAYNKTQPVKSLLKKRRRLRKKALKHCLCCHSLCMFSKWSIDYFQTSLRKPWRQLRAQASILLCAKQLHLLLVVGITIWSWLLTLNFLVRPWCTNHFCFVGRLAGMCACMHVPRTHTKARRAS